MGFDRSFTRVKLLQVERNPQKALGYQDFGIRDIGSLEDRRSGHFIVKNPILFWNVHLLRHVAEIWNPSVFQLPGF
jgi:hypothetical protein